MPNLLPGGRRSTSISVTPSQKRLHQMEDGSKDGIMRSSSNQRVSFVKMGQSPGARNHSPSPQSSLNNTMNMNGSATSLGDNLTIRKNNYRQSQLKKIDSENLKIFQNLLRIKSSISKTSMVKHQKDNTNFRQMLAHYDQKVDPLITIEQRHKFKIQQKRQQSPFVGKINASSSGIATGITRAGTIESMANGSSSFNEVPTIKRGLGGYNSAHQSRFASNQHRASEIIRSAAAAQSVPRNLPSPKLSQTLPVTSIARQQNAQIRTI